METLGESELCFPHLLNASCVKPKRPHFETILTYVMVFFVSLLTVFLNLLVIISISHFKQLHTPTNLLILSLAVSDFFMGLLLLFQIIIIDGCWFLGDLMCMLYQYASYIISSTSVGAIVLISIDRYVAICHPLHYSTKVTQKRVKMCLYLCWICSVIFKSLIMKDNLEQPGRFNTCFGECVFAVNHIAAVADVIVNFFGSIAIIVLLYTRVFVVAVSQARAMRSHVAAVTLQGSKKVSAKKSEIKAARTLGIVIFIYIVCLCPYHIIVISGKASLIKSSAGAFIVCFYYSNACLNPLIYALFYPWFRNSIKLIVTLKILQPGSCETNMI